MAVVTWRVLAFGTLMGAMALPASAQVVIGGSGRPSVEVNWAVLDSLGREPTLADLLKGEPPPALQNAPMAAGKAKSGPQGVQFKPYKPAKTDVVKAKAKVSTPKKTAATPAVAKAEPALAASPVATLVQATQQDKPAAMPPKPQVAEVPALPAAKPVAATAVVGPVVSLPEVPKSASVPAQAVEAAPAPVEPAVTAKAEPAPQAVPAPVAAPTALTPPPLPVPEPQVAALPPVPAQVPVSVVSSSKGDTLSVVFGSESATLPANVQPQLDALVKRLRKEDNLGLQLLAFAEGDDANASRARRLSLSRALEVRKYLMEQGVRSTRIEVRALGNKMEGSGPADRVDAVLVSR